MNITRRFKSCAGQSLVGALVGIGLLGVMAAVMASLFESQNKEIRSLSEKLAIVDVQKMLTVSLSDGSV